VKLKIRVLSIVIIASKSKDDIILKVVGEEIMINDIYVTFFSFILFNRDKISCNRTSAA